MPDPTPFLFWCQDLLHLSKAVKESTLYATNAVLSLCQQQHRPQHLAGAIYFRAEKSLIGWGRQYTTPVSTQGAYFFLMLIQQGAEMLCPAVVSAVFRCCQLQFKLFLPWSRSSSRGHRGKGGGLRCRKHQELHINAVCQSGKEFCKQVTH